MALPYENVVNHSIKAFAEKEKPSMLDWNHLKAISQVQKGLIEYEALGRNMSFEQLLREAHDSSRLARHMGVMGDPRPHNLCDCHAIIAGKDPRSVPMRAVMAWLKMRIDFPLNGVWLPHNTAAKPQMPKHLAAAVPHSRIHRNGYYRWLATIIDQSSIQNEKSLADALKLIRFKLETSSFPSYVMLPADQLL
ncbi:AHH domain-containing protein [Thalassolituus oleivorans]|uniref:AHH domain-containing protein n=1 Tax=Thalassolituus oleivorans TaxID=187493 RepID=UPI001CE308D7|nr:AHH domain-containing protein [Thalassolituus oleivorans]MCA6129181.1 hypothetical protein [Thalassolituus oleivorans 4BN06-13]